MMILEATMVVVMIMDLMGIMGMLQMTWIFRGLVILRIKIMAIKGMAKNNKGIMEKGGGSHQVQKKVKVPISFGSLNNDVLTEGMKNNISTAPSNVLQHSSVLPLCCGENSKFSPLKSSFYANTDKDSSSTPS
jgi:hypothetical protein